MVHIPRMLTCLAHVSDVGHIRGCIAATRSSFRDPILTSRLAAFSPLLHRRRACGTLALGMLPGNTTCSCGCCALVALTCSRKPELSKLFPPVLIDPDDVLTPRPIGHLSVRAVHLRNEPRMAQRSNVATITNRTFMLLSLVPTSLAGPLLRRHPAALRIQGVAHVARRGGASTGWAVSCPVDGERWAKSLMAGQGKEVVALFNQESRLLIMSRTSAQRRRVRVVLRRALGNAVQVCLNLRTEAALRCRLL